MLTWAEIQQAYLDFKNDLEQVLLKPELNSKLKYSD